MIYYTLEDLAVKAFSFLRNDVFRKVNMDFFENILDSFKKKHFCGSTRTVEKGMDINRKEK